MTIPVYFLEVGSLLVLLSLFTLTYCLKFYIPVVHKSLRTYKDILSFISPLGVIGGALLLLAHLQISYADFNPNNSTNNTIYAFLSI